MSESHAHRPLHWLRKAFPTSTETVNLPAVLLCLAFLALLTLADTLTTSAVPAVFKDKTPLEPGYWNLGAATIIASTLTDLVAQTMLGNLADRKGRNYAIFLNTTSVLLTSVFTLFAPVFGQQKPVLATVIAPLLKFVGGGSHASAFLALVLLHDQASEGPLVASFYATGAIVTLCQAAGAALVAPLLKQDSSLPSMLSIVCCLLAYVVGIAYVRLQNSSDSPLERNNSTTQPLLPNPEQLSETEPAIDAVANYRPLFLVSLVFFIAAISKATRPLFTSYIQRRYGVSPTKAQQLWLMRTAMSTVIFALILPLVVLVYPQATYSPTRIASSAARVSICLMGLGALMIGLALTEPVLIVALVVNTLGVAMDLSLLASIVSIIPKNVVGRVYFLIASLESVGSLIGIGVLYPIYQWSLEKGSWTGGTAYYICAALYAIVTVLIWQV